MYAKGDPRGQLTLSRAEQTSRYPADVKYIEFHHETPRKLAIGSEAWLARGQNYFVHYIEGKAGERLTRSEQPDEYIVILPDVQSEAHIEWNGKSFEMKGNSLAIIPKGASSVQLTTNGRCVQLFSSQNTELEPSAINQSDYASPDTNVAELIEWPAPVTETVHVYSLDIQETDGRFGRIFRSTNFMVNVLYPYEGPRDPAKLSPHSHDEFEQCSLVLSGNFVHHMRWPWTPDRTEWKEDTHREVGSPSITVIPPGVIHTSEATGEGSNILIDIFAPPREDFSQQPGWVLNEDDYPVDTTSFRK